MLFSQQAQHQRIQTDAGQWIELKIAWQATKKLALICHPHPLQGGSMDNKVITTLANSCFEHNMSVVIFNFRGVGASTGIFNDGIGEVQDAQAVLLWTLAQTEHSIDHVIVAGFSFGSMIAANLLIMLNCNINNDQVYIIDKLILEKLILVAPPVDRYDYPLLPKQITHVIMGDIDDVVKPSSVYEWCQQQHYTLHKIHDAGHFFHKCLLDLSKCVQKIVA